MSIPKNGLEVPHTRLVADVLRRLAEEYVTRDGTDYGAVEKTLEEKVSALRRRLERGDAAIVYDAETGSIDIVPRPQRSERRPWRAAGGSNGGRRGRPPKSTHRDQ